MKLLVAWIALLLQAGPSSTVTQTPRASIDGVVIRAGTDEPIAGARVTVATAGAGARSTIPPAATDRDGRFSIKDLPAGVYTLTVLSNGYARHSYGQRQAGGQGALISLTEGQSIRNVSIRLTPAGNVSGHVRNARGRPVPGANVELVRRTYNSRGQQDLETIARARSDDRGHYRLYWVTPGRYFLRTAATVRVGNTFIDSPIPNEISGKYASTFFPGTTQSERAIAVDVRPGDELEGMDFVLADAALYRISARVVDPATGQPPRQALAAISSRGSSVGGGNLYNPQTGMMVFTNVTAGVYTVSISTYEGSGFPNSAFNRSSAGLSAGADVIVTNADVDLGVLRLEAPLVINGRLTGDTPPPDPATEVSIRIAFLTEREGYNAWGERNVFSPPGSRFTAYSPYSPLRVAVTELPDGFYVKEARLDGADALTGFARVSRSSELEIVLSSKAALLEGVVRDRNSQPAAGARVVLVPDANRYRNELFKEATSDQNGHFSISRIAPGDYKVFAWDSLEPYAYFDPEVLRKHEQNGMPVRILESSRKTLELRMIPAEVE